MLHRFLLRPSAKFVSVGVALFTAAATATGQTVAGTARDASTQAPLACLHVSLLDSAGAAVHHSVTDSLGQFYLDAPKPGAYRVQFATSGWAPLDGPLDTLADVDFKQGIYPVAFTNMLRAIQPDSLPHKLIPRDKRFDRATVDSILAPRRRLVEEARRREESSGWKSRRLVPRSPRLQYPTGLREGRIEGGAIVRFIVDSTGRARRDSWTVIKTSHNAFAKELRSFLDARWTPSSNAGQPVCDLAQYYVRFEFDTRDPLGRSSVIVIMNE